MIGAPIYCEMNRELPEVQIESLLFFLSFEEEENFNDISVHEKGVIIIHGSLKDVHKSSIKIMSCHACSDVTRGFKSIRP